VRALSFLLGCCGAVLALLAWQGVAALLPIGTDGASMAVRLGQGAAALLPGAGVLALMVAVQMGARFILGVFDPLAGQETRFLRRNQRIITNTVEQLAIFAPSLLALAAGAPGARMGEVAALGVVFALARLAFWAGYLAAPVTRAPGMAATIVTSVGTLLAASWLWLA
jgi:uncharacterized MAPEG superfamily protein